MKKHNLTLKQAWNKRCGLIYEGYKLRTEGYKLQTEGYKLYLEGDKLLATGDKFYAEGLKLRAEGLKLQAEGTLIWTNTVLRIKGNIGLEYKDWNSNLNLYKTCILETGEIFKYKE